MNFLRQYLVAVQFFTRMPVTGGLAQWIGPSPAMLRESAAHFPGVGWLVGLVACTTFALVDLVLPGSLFAPLVAAIACTAATVLLTGAFHEHALARVADGLGATAPREQALDIMRDSRTGSYGVLALCLTLLAKVSLLTVLAGQSPVAVLTALLGGHVVSRFWPLVLLRTLPFVGDAGAAGSKPLVERIGPRALGVAAAWCVLPLALAAVAQGLAFMMVGVLLGSMALWLMRRLFLQRLQGFTDDCLGATQQVCEIGFYFGAAVGLSVG